MHESTAYVVTGMDDVELLKTAVKAVCELAIERKDKTLAGSGIALYERLKDEYGVVGSMVFDYGTQKTIDAAFALSIA